MTRRRHLIPLLIVGSVALTAAPAALARDFVVDASACARKGDGGNAVDFCTIQEAIDAAYANGGGDVVVMPGIYREVLTLREEIRVQGDEAGVVVELPAGATPPALVVTANQSGLENLTLRLPEGAEAAIPMILISNVEEVELEDIVLDGGFNRGSVGVYVQNQLLETSRIRKSTLSRLEVGILAEDTRLQITRCLFEDILRDAIYVRPPLAKAAGTTLKREFEAPEIGDDEDLEFSGFNRFRNIGGFEDDLGQPIHPDDAFLLRNTTGEPLLAQLNDWGLYDPAEIAVGLSSAEPGAKALPSGTDPVVFEPYLGKSVFPGSVFVRIRDMVSNTALNNATPRLKLGVADTGINPVFDSVSKLYSFTFVNPNTYSVLAQAPAHLPASRAAVVGPAEIVAMDIFLTPDATEGEVPIVYHSTDQNGNGRISLSELLRVVQIYNSATLHCEAGTEDGYGLGDGPHDCAPHAADYAPQNWSIGFSELLRIIQFYNSAGYYSCAGTEDGFCVGLPPV